MLSKLLEEKQGVLKALDSEIVATCLTEEIEWEVQEAKEVYEKIVESLAAIDHVEVESTAKGRMSAQVMVSILHHVSRLFHMMN